WRCSIATACTVRRAFTKRPLPRVFVRSSGQSSRSLVGRDGQERQDGQDRQEGQEGQDRRDGQEGPDRRRWNVPTRVLPSCPSRLSRPSRPWCCPSFAS